MWEIILLNLILIHKKPNYFQRLNSVSNSKSKKTGKKIALANKDKRLEKISN